MNAMASQITSLTIVYSIVYSGVDQRKHQSSASLAFVRGIHRWPVNSPHKGPATQKMFPFDDVIMTIMTIHHSGVTCASWRFTSLTTALFGQQLYIYTYIYPFVMGNPPVAGWFPSQECCVFHKVIAIIWSSIMSSAMFIVSMNALYCTSFICLVV